MHIDDILVAAINHADSGDNTIVAALGAGKRIVVLSVMVRADAAVDVRFEDGAGGTPFTGQIPLTAVGDGFTHSGGMMPLWLCSENTLLNMELSGAVNVHGTVTYLTIG